MESIYYIDRIARFLVCDLLPLCVLIASLIFLLKKDKICSLDYEKIKEEQRAVEGYAVLVILFIVLSNLVMNNHIYTWINTKIQALFGDPNDVIIKAIVDIIGSIGIAVYLLYKLFLKITIYPELTFRIVPGQIKRTRSRRFFQFATQFWNAGIFPHHHIKVSLTRYVREQNGNLKLENVSMHEPKDDNYIKSVFYSQDERAYTWYSTEDKWDADLQPSLFEYMEIEVKSEAWLAHFTKSLEISNTKRFYPEDIHQGDFVDLSTNKAVPQSLVTLYDNKEYVSAKRNIQKWDEGLRFAQCILFIVFFVLAIVLACVEGVKVSESLVLSQRITLALFLVLTAWRILLMIPIKAVALPSHIYGSQQ